MNNIIAILLQAEQQFLDFKRMQNLDFMEIDGLWKFMTSKKCGYEVNSIDKQDLNVPTNYVKLSHHN